ncbi:MAG: ABC transporter ATP-binding protein [Chloroflexota bacterium]|nr:ABC transporter ATP-binding protein [Chloroflexota bacterium]
MSILLLDLLSKRYEKGRWALRDISLRMETGVWGFVGPNGAGKTTLLRILATLMAPTQGVVTWNGQDILRHPQVLRRDLGYLPQDFGVYPQLTARELLRYIGELKGLKGPLLQRRVAASLEMVHLATEADRRLRTFSGGMIRRLGIAQALLNEPRVLILDEPTVGLDPAERVHFRETIASLQGERLVILSTHIITDVEAMATDIALLQRGEILWKGTPAALQSDAPGSTWALSVSVAEFERLRATSQVSMAIRRGGQVETRLIAPTRPHPDAMNVEPTLEEAYLCLLSENEHVQPLNLPVG